METKLKKWGNSVALRIPQALTEQIEVAEGSTVLIKVRDGMLIIKPLHRYSLKELLRGVSPRNLHSEVDTGSPVGRESW